MKKLYILAIFALFVGAGLGASTHVKAVDNVNFITVSSCEQVGADIRISLNNGPKYVLTSSCRDAGYGKRLYKMSCVSSTQYRVEWSTPASCTNTTTTQDTIAPIVSLASNTSTVSNGQSVSLTANASDAKGVQKIEIREGSTVVKICTGTNLTSCVYTFVAASQQWTERLQTFTAKAYDAAGNVGTSNSVNIRTRALVESIKPEVSILLSANNIKTGGQITVTSTASDASGISKIDIYRNGAKVKTCSNLTTCIYITALTLPSWSNSQIYSFYTRAIDNQGNWKNSDIKEVSVTR